jgi:beta-glucosidase
LVLLKNDGILPLDRAKYKRIAVIGPNGDSKSMLEGNYHGSASRPVSILSGIKQLAGLGIEVTFALGSPITTVTRTAAWSAQDNATTRPLAELTAEALKNAAAADLIVYVGGITPAQEGEGFDRSAIELPDVQEKLVQALQGAGKPMVMVNCSGSAVALTWEDEHLPAILQAWYPGGDGGRAVAEVLFGEVNPSGRLPVTFYRATADMPAFTDYSMANRTYRFFSGKPLYAFGHGLSYTSFDFESGKLDSQSVAADGTAKMTFTVKNTGKSDGDEVAQVYYRHVNSKVPQPKLSLCGFSRVSLKSGKSTEIAMEIPAERLRYWDAEKKQYVVEAGDYEFLVGAASDDIRLKLPVTIRAGNPGPAQPAAAAPTRATRATPAPAKEQGAIRIKAGSSAPFTDSAGNVWKAEEGFEGGSTIERPDIAIANTKDAGLPVLPNHTRLGCIESNLVTISFQLGICK